MADTSLIIPTNTPADEDFSLRPKTLSEYIGQEKAKGNLEIFIQAAKSGVSPWITSCCTGRPALGRRLSPISSQWKWE